MFALLIADDDPASRQRLASLLMEEGYDVFTTDSVADVIEGILTQLTQVVILGTRIGGTALIELLPVLSRCKGEFKVIVASDETQIAAVRRLRREGIFYLLAKPVDAEDGEEVRQVVQCAFETLKSRRGRIPCGT
ncbi:MAG: response regulator [Deferrisomatales bacterium]